MTICTMNIFRMTTLYPMNFKIDIEKYMFSKPLTFYGIRIVTTFLPHRPFRMCLRLNGLPHLPEQCESPRSHKQGDESQPVNKYASVRLMCFV